MSKKVPKLSDEELSRILGEADRGRLRHWMFYNPITGCGCAAGAAMNLEAFVGLDRVPPRAAAISRTIYDYDTNGGFPSLGAFQYPSSPDEVLRLLEDRGLA